MREQIKGSTDGNRKGSYVSTRNTTYRRKPREAVTVNVIADEQDLQRYEALQSDADVSDVRVHVTKRRDARMITYVDERRKK